MATPPASPETCCQSQAQPFANTVAWRPFIGFVHHAAFRRRAHANRCWLEDMAVRLICVLALDRFGDYMTEQVSLPPLPLVASRSRARRASRAWAPTRVSFFPFSSSWWGWGWGVGKGRCTGAGDGRTSSGLRGEAHGPGAGKRLCASGTCGHGHAAATAGHWCR